MPRHVYLMILLLILSACGGNSTDETPEASATPPSKTTLTISYSRPDLAAGLENLAASFAGSFPHVTLILTQSSLQTFQNEFQGGAGADLYIGSAADYQSLMRQSILIPLRVDILDQDILLVPAQSYQAVLQQNTPYAFPLLLQTPALFINTALVEGEISRFADVAALDQPAQVASDFAQTSGWLEIDNFVRPIAPDGNLDIQAATFAAYLQRLQQLNQSGQVEWVSKLDVRPETAWAVGSSQEITDIRAVWGENLALLPLIVDEPDHSYQLGDATLMMISLNATAENQLAAHQFIKWSVQPTQQDAFSQATRLSPLWNTLTTDPILQASATLGQNAAYVPFTSSYYTETLAAYNTAIAQVLSGVLSPEEASAGLFRNEE